MGDGSSFHRPAVGVRLTPVSYPVTLTSVTIYAKNNTGSDQACNLYGYSDLPTETSLFVPVMNVAIPDTGTRYVGKTVSIPPTTISSGSFYLVLEWVTRPLSSASGTNTFFVCTDSHLDYVGASLLRFTGARWVPLESVSAGAGDIGIFAGYGTNAIHEEPVVAAVSPDNGATGINRTAQELAIRFSKEMAAGHSVLGDAIWSLSESTPVRWSSDHKTVYISRDNAAASLPALTLVRLIFNAPGYNPSSWTYSAIRSTRTCFPLPPAHEYTVKADVNHATQVRARGPLQYCPTPVKVSKGSC